MSRPLITIVAVALLSTALFAAEKVQAKAKTLADRKAEKVAARDKYEREQGGEVIRPGTMKGRLLIANAQKLIDPFEIEEIRDFLWDQLSFKIDVEMSEMVTPETVGATLRKSGAICGVFLVEDKNLPILLMAPEDHWAIVNCSRLAEGAKTSKYIEMRIKKEIVRAFTLVCSGGSSMYPNSMFDAISSASDLDRIGQIEFKMDNLDRFRNHLAPLGATPAIHMSYANAVYEGWAPAPTNAIQRKIWDEAHAPPSKPIKITYDKDKQKPLVK